MSNICLGLRHLASVNISENNNGLSIATVERIGFYNRSYSGIDWFCFDTGGMEQLVNIVLGLALQRRIDVIVQIFERMEAEARKQQCNSYE